MLYETAARSAEVLALDVEDLDLPNARRERSHPGAQLTLFEAEDGWRYTLWVTNLPGQIRGWRGQPAYIDAAHRVHARVEDSILPPAKTAASANSPPAQWR